MNADRFANLRLAGWRAALRVLAVQFAALVVAWFIAMLTAGGRTGMGVLVGAGIGLLANVYSALALLGKPLAQRHAVGVLIGWLIRVGLTLSLLLIAMRANFAPPWSLIAGLAAVYVAHWLTVSFWLRGRR